MLASDSAALTGGSVGIPGLAPGLAEVPGLAPAPADISEAAPGTSTDESRGRRHACAGRILVVDDQPDVLDLLCIVLGNEGFAVEPVADGREALKRLEQTAPGLVLLDLMMPQVDGWQVLHGLSRTEVAPPAIVVTARCDSAAFVQAFRGGAAGFVAKPFELAHLVATCRTALELRPSELSRVPERRRSRRRPFLVKAQIRRGEHSGSGVLIDLSREGARITTDAELHLGDVLSVDVRLTRSSVPLSVRGSVVWRGAGRADEVYGLKLNLGDAQTAAHLGTLFGNGRPS